MPNAYPVLYRLGMDWWEDNDDTGPLADVVAHRPPGVALDAGCGTGRHAIWLAQQGWTVVGVDGVEKALREARASAGAAGVAERTSFIRADVARMAEVPATPPYDLVVDIGCFHGLRPDQQKSFADWVEPPHPRGRRRGRARGRPADRRRTPGHRRGDARRLLRPRLVDLDDTVQHQGRRSAAPRRLPLVHPVPHRRHDPRHRGGTAVTTPLTQFTRLIDEAFNAGDLTVLDELVSPDFVEHQFEIAASPRSGGRAGRRGPRRRRAAGRRGRLPSRDRGRQRHR